MSPGQPPPSALQEDGVSQGHNSDAANGAAHRRAPLWGERNEEAERNCDQGRAGGPRGQRSNGA